MFQQIRCGLVVTLLNEFKILDENTVKLILNPTWEFDGKNGDNFSNLFNKWGLGLHIVRGEKCDDIIFEDKVLYGHIGFAYGLLGSIYFNVEENQSIFQIQGCGQSIPCGAAIHLAPCDDVCVRVCVCACVRV